jgi:hypothetical protein
MTAANLTKHSRQKSSMNQTQSHNLFSFSNPFNYYTDYHTRHMKYFFFSSLQCSHTRQLKIRTRNIPATFQWQSLTPPNRAILERPISLRTSRNSNLLKEAEGTLPCWTYTTTGPHLELREQFRFHVLFLQDSIHSNKSHSTTVIPASLN